MEATATGDCLSSLRRPKERRLEVEPARCRGSRGSSEQKQLLKRSLDSLYQLHKRLKRLSDSRFTFTTLTIFKAPEMWFTICAAHSLIMSAPLHWRPAVAALELLFNFSPPPQMYARYRRTRADRICCKKNWKSRAGSIDQIETVRSQLEDRTRESNWRSELKESTEGVKRQGSNWRI